ncbi:hypothetical protein OXX59_010378, partial [Metschnikowia pulcherrima]
TISVGAILGLRHDLKMTGERYSWAGSAFYFGYLFYEFIGSYTLQRFDLSTVLSAYIILWGILLCLHSVPQYAGFVVLRVLLGALESSITPAFVIITSQWYRKEEVFFQNSASVCLERDRHHIGVWCDSVQCVPRCRHLQHRGSESDIPCHRSHDDCVGDRYLFPHP